MSTRDDTTFDLFTPAALSCASGLSLIFFVLSQFICGLLPLSPFCQFSFCLYHNHIYLFSQSNCESLNSDVSSGIPIRDSQLTKDG